MVSLGMIQAMESDSLLQVDVNVFYRYFLNGRYLSRDGSLFKNPSQFGDRFDRASGKQQLWSLEHQIGKQLERFVN